MEDLQIVCTCFYSGVERQGGRVAAYEIQSHKLMVLEDKRVWY